MLDQLRMSAALDDMSVVQYKDLIGVADGFQTVGNHDDGLVMGQCLDSPLQFILILRVNAACCLVQNDDRCVLQHGAGDGNPLFLAAGQSAAALANHGVIAIRQGRNKVMAASLFRRFNHLFMGSIRTAKAHVTALHDSRIETEARRIVDKLKDLSAPNSPNKTHFMVEISPHFDALASTKDNDRLFAMLPYKSLCFTSIKDRHGVYAMINKDERRDVSIRKPRPSIRKQLADSKQATSPKKAAARTKKNELEV